MWKDLPDWDEGLSKLLAGILDRSHPAVWQAPVVESNEEPDYTAATIDKISRLPGLHNYPLWRVHRRVSRSPFVLTRAHDHQLGVEEEALFFLMQRLMPLHEL